MGDQKSNMPFKSKCSHSPGPSKEAPEDFLLFLCEHSRPVSSPHPCYPQSSCCWSREESVWSQCRCIYSYSLWNALTKQPWTVLAAGAERAFLLILFISQKLYVLAGLAPAFLCCPQCHCRWSCTCASARLQDIALVSSCNLALSKSVKIGTNNFVWITSSTYKILDGVQKWLH